MSPSGDYLYRYRHSLSSRQCYADSHGYSHIVDVLSYPRPYTLERYDWNWGKIHSAVQRLEYMLLHSEKRPSTLGTFDEWLVLLDVDFAIQRMSTRIEEFFDFTKSFDLFLSDNLSGEFNTGFFAIRVSTFSLEILKRLQSMEPLCSHGWRNMDQSAFNLQLAFMIQERLCSNSSSQTRLPSSHSACKFDLGACMAAHCYDPGPECYLPFGKLLPAELWSYGNRRALPWLYAYVYRGENVSSPLVDFNRFYFHDPKHNPLSKPSDWGSHAKEAQEPYQQLIRDMDSIGPDELFCEALLLKRS